MVKKILNWLSPLNWFFAKNADKISETDYARLQKNAFSKPSPILKPALENKLVVVTERPVTEKEMVEDEFSTVNWSRVTVEGKKKLIAIAKEDILMQIESRPAFPLPLNTSH